MHPYTIMGLAWLVSAVWIGFVILSNRKAHPKALFYLFFVEMWERFSYYGMRALLVLYMTNGMLKYTPGEAYGVYGAYGSMVYATPLIGGLLAERFMGYRKAIMWGAILMMIGHFLMAFEHEQIFLTALAMLILGNGFFKPNISSMIGKFYAKKDPRRDGAFTIFYMGINIGAFLTGLTCGVIGEIEGWHWGFSLAGVGMLIGLLIVILAQKQGVLEDKGFAPHEVEEYFDPNIDQDEQVAQYRKVENPVAPKIAGLSANLFIYIVSLLSIPLIWVLLQKHEILDLGLLAIGVGMVIYLISSSFQYEPVQRQRVWVIITLFFFSMIFWTFFELAGSALTVFTDNNVKKTGFLTTTMFQSLNPLFIMLFAPVFSWIWINLSKRNIEPAAPIKFGIALLLLGAGFWVLNLGSGSAQAGMIPAIFMILLYLLHTLGELALSPVGLSLVTKLSPAKVVGFVMGFWLMSSSFAHLAGGKIAKMTDVNMATMLHETERLNRFNENLADEKIKAAWVNNKEFYAMYVGKNASEEAIKKYEAVHKGDSNLIKLCKKGHSVQSYITSKYFLDELNKGLEAPAYFVGQVADAEMMAAADKTDNEVYKQKLMDEGVQSFLTTDASYVVAEGQKPKELKAEDIKELIAKSPNGMINEAVAKDTLVICLGVFAQLGMFAMGAGLFLILLSPIINRWMHGIK